MLRNEWRRGQLNNQKAEIERRDDHPPSPRWAEAAVGNTVHRI
jgi:hypothetical protein